MTGIAERENTPASTLCGGEQFVDCSGLLWGSLLKWGLESVMIDQEQSNGKTIIECLEKYIADCCSGIVLLTPDDIGYLKGDESNKRNRPRQNVVLEFGMLMMKYGRSKIVLIEKIDDEIELPSDIAGMRSLRYSNRLDEIAYNLSKELKNNGYVIL